MRPQRRFMLLKHMGVSEVGPRYSLRGGDIAKEGLPQKAFLFNVMSIQETESVAFQVD